MSEVKETVSETDNFVITTSDAPATTEVKEVETLPAVSTETVEEVKTEIEPVIEEHDEVVTGEPKGDDATAEPVKSEKKNGTQKRIDKLTRQREDEKRKSEGLQKELDDLKNNNAAEYIAPKEDDYEDYEKYLDAKDKFEAEPKKPAKKESKEEGSLTDSQKTALAIIDERYEADENKPKDFDSVAFSNEVKDLITPTMVEAMVECENTTDIMYHLGKNIDQAKKISGMSSTQQMIAIAKLDTKKASPQKTVKTSKAAPPISPVKGSDTPQKKSLNEQSYSEFEKTRNKQEGKKRHW